MGTGILDKAVETAAASWETTPSTTALSIVDDPTKCVPWGTCAVEDGGAPFSGYLAVELDFLASPLRLRRKKGVSIIANDNNTFVTQLNSSRVRVQAVSYALTSAQLTKNIVIPSAIVIANSFPLCYHLTPDGGYAQAGIFVKPTFTSTTQLTITRGQAEGALEGVAYIVEALDGAFTVQTSSIHITETNTSNTGTITSIATDRTILIATWNSQAYPYTSNGTRGLPTVVLTNATTITAFRYSGSSGDDLDILVYAVTFASDVASVQHFSANVTSGTYVDVTISSVDITRSIVRTNNNAGMNNTCRVSTTDANPTAQHVKCTLTSATNVRLTIGKLTTNTITGCVIQFENYNPNPSPGSQAALLAMLLG
jgi:hypothetical protein